MDNDNFNRNDSNNGNGDNNLAMVTRMIMAIYYS